MNKKRDSEGLSHYSADPVVDVILATGTPVKFLRADH
jgi:hypothetical protein